jgi:hypothetical protein
MDAIDEAIFVMSHAGLARSEHDRRWRAERGLEH